MTRLAAFAAVMAAGVLSAAAALWIFARFSDAAEVRAARRRIKASLYELRLFVDEPAVLLRAQGRLLRSNLRYLRLMLPPAALLAVPMLLLMTVLDAVYGYRPLEPGEAALVTVTVRPSVDLRSIQPWMEATAGFAVETPAVRIPGEHRVCWRIRPARAASATLRVFLNGSVYVKSVRAGAGFAMLSRERVRSLFAWILHPLEPRLPPGDVERIEVAYPNAWMTAFGLALPWLAWFFLAVVIAALWLR